MSETYADYPDHGPTTSLRFVEALEGALSANARQLLNQLMRAVTERGWLPSVDSFCARLVEDGDTLGALEQAMTELRHYRLLVLSSDETRFQSILGGLSLSRTPHRIHLENGAELFATGGMELLGAGTLVGQPVSVSSRCATCGAPVSFEAQVEGLSDVSPAGIAGYQATWRASESLESCAARSPLYCSDTCLDAAGVNEDLGLPLSSGLLLPIGVPAVQDLSRRRFELFAFHH